MNRLFLIACAFIVGTGCHARPQSDPSGQSGNNSNNVDEIDQPASDPYDTRVEIYAQLFGTDADSIVYLYGKSWDGDQTNWIANAHATPIDSDADGYGEIGGLPRFTVECGEEITLQCDFFDRWGTERWCAENDPYDGSENFFFGRTVWIDGIPSELRSVPNGEGGFNAVATRECYMM